MSINTNACEFVDENYPAALYAERLRAFFALSGARLVQDEGGPHGRVYYYILPRHIGPIMQTFRGEPCSSAFITENAAMRSALREMGVAGVD